MSDAGEREGRRTGGREGRSGRGRREEAGTREDEGWVSEARPAVLPCPPSSALTLSRGPPSYSPATLLHAWLFLHPAVMREGPCQACVLPCKYVTRMQKSELHEGVKKARRPPCTKSYMKAGTKLSPRNENQRMCKLFVLLSKYFFKSWFS